MGKETTNNGTSENPELGLHSVIGSVSLSADDVKNLKLILNYFGENDKSVFEHIAFSHLKNILNRIESSPKTLSTKENKCKYTNTLNEIHAKISSNEGYWLFTEIFCLLHDGHDSCNCR